MTKKEKVEDVNYGEIKAFLGEGTVFKGVISFSGTVRIDGQVEGQIVGDDLLIIGEPAVLQAEIEVGTVVISGRLEGNVTAKKKVEILAAGSVKGTIRTPALVIAEGATFNGDCEMGRETGVGLPPSET